MCPILSVKIGPQTHVPCCLPLFYQPPGCGTDVPKGDLDRPLTEPGWDADVTDVVLLRPFWMEAE